MTLRLGLVFCIYADSHGVNSIYDGVPHYLLETKRILKENRTPNEPETNYFSGFVRGYSSKAPQFCPYCKKPYFTYKKNDKIKDFFSIYDDEPKPEDIGC